MWVIGGDTDTVTLPELLSISYRRYKTEGEKIFRYWALLCSQHSIGPASRILSDGLANSAVCNRLTSHCSVDAVQRGGISRYRML